MEFYSTWYCLLRTRGWGRFYLTKHDKRYLLMIPEIFEWVLNLPLLCRPIYVYTSVHIYRNSCMECGIFFLLSRYYYSQYYCSHQYWPTIFPLISTLRDVLISNLGKWTILNIKTLTFFLSKKEWNLNFHYQYTKWKNLKIYNIFIVLLTY